MTHSYPLQNVKVLYTGDEQKYRRYESGLLAEKAVPICIPFIRIHKTEVSEETLKMVQNREYSAVIFTSSNAVKYGVNLFPKKLLNLLTEGQIPAFCVGKYTGQSLLDKGIRHIIYPKREQSLKGLLALDELNACKNRYVLYPSGNLADKNTDHAFSKLGIHVDRVEVYGNMIPPDTEENAHNYFSQNAPGWIIINSPSAGIRLIDWGTRKNISFADINFALIGNTTRRCFDKICPGYNYIISDFPTLESIIEVIKQFQSTLLKSPFK